MTTEDMQEAARWEDIATSDVAKLARDERDFVRLREDLARPSRRRPLIASPLLEWLAWRIPVIVALVFLVALVQFLRVSR